MKRMWIFAVVLVAGLVAVSIADAQFGNIRVPGVGSVSGDVAQIEYDSCKSFIGKYDNNVDWNSKNLFSNFESNKDVKLVKYTKDYTKSGSKWDKENMAKDAEFNYKNFCTINANCTKEKCRVYCYKK